MNKFLSLSVLTLSTSIAFASHLEITGQVDVKIPAKDKNGEQKTYKFKLPKYNLTPEVRNKIKMKLKHYPSNVYQQKVPKFAMELPPKVDLGMEGTPVLDQGAHGSCVTFAVSGAINATLGAGDYVSPLCSLELGATLAINDEIPFSGWNGSYGDIVLSQMMTYGVVSKNHQKYHGCAGVFTYPEDDEMSEGRPMDKAEYMKASIPIKDVVQWDMLMSDFGIRLTNQDGMFDPAWMAKEELAKGHRLSIGMLLDVNYGIAGAVGTHKAYYDTWMITPEIIMDAISGDIYAGHELVVTGYDDNVIVYDDNGYYNKGVFKVRNSWSPYIGDQGDFYITYDHFNIFVGEMHALYLKK
ncbi:hypothetical protein [Legionella sp. W05-934-2]|jgi:hypothetical protein|uniref:C1 family peptidase n=1 Tax=Legionella sp. W05-934-2 TaxID=1198649 RepID=UPI003461AEBC